MRCEVQVKEAELPESEKLRYLTLSIKGRHRLETTSKFSGGSPNFETNFSFTYPDREAGSLRVRLYEDNPTDVDQKLARVIIPLKDLPDNEARDDWYVLATKDGNDVAKVHLILTVSPADEVSDDTPDLDLDEIKDLIGSDDELSEEKQAEAEPAPSEDAAKPAEDAPKPAEEAPKPAEEAPKPAEEAEKSEEAEKPDFLKDLDDNIDVDLPDDITVPEKVEREEEAAPEPPAAEAEKSEEAENPDFLKGLSDTIDVDLPDEINVPEKTEANDDAVAVAPAEAQGGEAAGGDNDRGKSRVRVTIVEAKGITSVGNENLVDPYCTVQITGHKRRAKTRVVRGTATPVWNQEFVFHVPHTSSESVTVLLKDREGSDSNEVLGKVVIQLADVGDRKEDWWSIEPVTGKERGSMHLVVAVEPTDEESDDDPAQYDLQSADEESTTEEEEDKLDGAVKVLAKVEVVGAKGIDKIDACCRVQVLPRTKVYKTKVIKDSDKPVWKEKFKWHLEDYTQCTLQVELLDRSAPVGTVELPLAQVRKGVFDNWLLLAPVGDAKKGGRVHIEISMEKTEELSDDAQEEEEDVIEVRLEESSVAGEEEDAARKDVKKPRNKKERLQDTARGYNQDPDEIESRARQMAEEKYKKWTKRMEQELKERPGLKNHPDRIIFNNEKDLEKEKQAREDPNQMSSKRLTKETEKCEQELDDVNAEIEQLQQEVQDMENTA